MNRKENTIKSNDVSLDKIKNKSPLSNLVNTLLDTDDVKRMRFYGKIFRAFHLKNTVTTDVSGRDVVIDGQAVTNFSSANYLGLEQHPRIIEAGIHGIKSLGNHSGCSRAFTSHENIIRLEEETSKLVGADKSLICANVSHMHTGSIPALFSGENCEIFIDKYAHASMYQASLMAKGKGTVLTRVDVDDLSSVKKLLSESTKTVKALLIDGLYSMQGNIPDIKSLQELCDGYNTVLYIDDAHGLGIYGENGGGVAELLDLSFDNMILVGSYQKGLGAFGAFISGPSSLIDYIRVSSKSYIFSGTLQPQSVEGALAALEVSRSDEGRQLREDLYRKSKYIRSELKDLGFDVLDPTGNSPIISVELGADLRTLMAGRMIFDDGIFLNSVLYPAVPKDKGILRISLNSVHSDEEITKLINSFEHLSRHLSTNKSKISENFKYLKEMWSSFRKGKEYDGISF